MFSGLKDRLLKYGPAWLVWTQLFGFMTWLIVYGVLRCIELDYESYARAYLGESVARVAKHGGIYALTFVLNRFLMPLRLLVSLYVVPRVAKPINGLFARMEFIRPYLPVEKKQE